MNATHIGIGAPEPAVTQPAQSAPSYPNRDLRQRELVPPAELAVCRALVIGVGAIGRQVALQLAAIGTPELDLVDDDVVGEENLAAQAYWPQDLGERKVQAAAEICRRINPDIVVSAHAERFRRSSVRSMGCFQHSRLAIFCCVDAIATRGIVWSAVKDHAAFWCDGRMAAEVVRVLVSGQPALDDYYATTLFAPEQAYAGSCTARSTIYAANIAAGLMVGQFARWLRGLGVERDLTLNMLAGELAIG